MSDLTNFSPRAHPKSITLNGQYVDLLPLNPNTHAQDLFKAFNHDDDWLYMPYGPFFDFENFQTWLKDCAKQNDPVFFAIISKTSRNALGVASFLRIDQIHATIEVGHIHFSRQLRSTTMASEAMYLMMKWVFENGYRRYEWKCNALNIRSRRAAQRLGFSYEGTFRQHMIIKAQNRDTAWFAMIDHEWLAINQAFQHYFSSIKTSTPLSLSTLTKPILATLDPKLI